jgi:hypothetical protein
MCKPFTQNPSQKPSVTQAKPFGYEREKNYTGVELEWNLNERQLSGLRHFFLIFYSVAKLVPVTFGSPKGMGLRTPLKKNGEARIRRVGS